MSNPFKNWTQSDVERFNAKSGPTLEEVTQADVALDEYELHNQILLYCERRGWIALHGSMAHRSYRTLGEFDFVILANHGRTFFIECKTKTGKLTEEQQGLQHWARRLGHAPHVIRSYQQFMDVVNKHRVPTYEPMPNAPEIAAGTSGTAP
jgi:hypothetical protein